jgi:transposase
LECVGETLRQALNSLAVVAPQWLREWVPGEWFDRYSRSFEEYRLPPSRAQRYALADQIGADGVRLLNAIADGAAPAWLVEVPAVETLRRVWVQQFVFIERCLTWRCAEDLPPGAQLISSPYDPEARYSKKRQTEWTGYKVHLTETCDEDLPHVITNVETTPATTSDFDLTPIIHAHLAEKDLLPSEHLLDNGYMSAEHLVTSRHEHNVDLVGPVAEDNSWQAQAEEGFAIASFVIDWEKQQAHCPQGHFSKQWLTGQSDRHQHPLVHIRFAAADCRECPVRAQCTRSATQPRSLTVRTREAFEALQGARRRQVTQDYHQRYAARAGIEGTISQGVAATDLRRSRYIGLAKTHLHHLFVALGMNVLRLGVHFADLPRACTRTSAFVALSST